MARLKIPVEDDDDSLPELEDLLKHRKPRGRNPQESLPVANAKRTAKDAQTLSRTPRNSKLRNDESAEILKPKQTMEGNKGVRKQRALRKIADNSVLLRPLEYSTDKCRKPPSISSRDVKLEDPRVTPKKSERKIGIPSTDEESAYQESDTNSEDDEENDESIVIPTRRKHKHPIKKPPAQRLGSGTQTRTTVDQALIEPCTPTPTKPFQNTEVQIPFHPQATIPLPLSRPSSSDQDRAAFLVYTPVRTVSPRKAPAVLRPSTPPLQRGLPRSRPDSPFKARIPPAPQRPDLDDFWSQEVVNEWNDQYSPKKALTSPRKKRSDAPPSDAESDYVCPSPTLSPRKSPGKKSAKEREARKLFESRKQELAETFLHELDQKITNGRIAVLAQKSGGVKLIWSKKLNSTAGRANWRREAVIKKFSDGTVEKTYTHHASIELAEKVIDDDDRLINVLAHEFCHLANFMISEVKDNPHGKEFKEWAKKCSEVFGNRGVIVTTKHSYAIDYKYVWECTNCAIEFKRHSKSIDPAKHTCGACKSKLVQTRPVVRKNVKVSDYQIFVKENFQRVKKESATASHGAVMEMIGKLYREEKAEKLLQTGASTVNELAQTLDLVTLEG